MANADISLLFGVLGEGSLSGESGSLIQSQLSQIMASLNKNPLKVKVALDTEAGGQKSWNSQLQSKLNAISASGKFSVQVSNIKIGAGAIADFKKQLNAVINTMNLDKGTSITLTADGIGEIKSQMEQAGAAATSAARKTAEFKVQLESLTSKKTAVQRAVNTLNNTAATDEERASIAEITQQYEAWATKIEEVRASKTSISDGYRSELLAEGSAIQDNITKLQQARQAAEEKSRAEAASANQSKVLTANTNEYNAALTKVNNALIQARNNQRNWTAAQTGKTSGDFSNIENQIRNLEQLKSELESGGLSADDFQRRYSNATASIKDSSEHIRAAGENTKTLSDRVGGLAGKFTSWLTISQVIMRAYQALQQMVTAVIDVDTAMTELRKVTDETEATYSQFLNTATTRAKELGATVSDTVTATADFARLGYNIDEASQLADAAIVYKNVGDGIEDISEASESIISTMQAFGIAAEDSMLVVDKFNEVGNNFAISSQGIGEALLRSASALAAGNNTLDESIALITTANTIVQNPEAVGTTMKTISMYLRAAKTEAEEAGVSTDGMANSVSELREEILALTGNKVDIQIDENTFKSTYQIIKEISEVWDELTDITQANILEMLGGKRNSNVVAAMIENFDIAESVVEDSANAAGSALAENEKYLDSINGKIAEFKATFQEFSVNLIDSDFVKGIVEFGTGLLNVLNVLAKVIDMVGGLNTVLGVTLGIVIAMNTKSIATFLTNLIKPIRSVIQGFSAIRQAGVGVGQAIANAFAQATAGATAFQTALGVIGIAIAALSIGVTIFQSIHKSTEELVESSNELKAAFQEVRSQTQSNIQTLEGLSTEFDRLSAGVDNYGRNVSLSADDYERYKEIVEQVVSISPSLIEGYDAENNALVNKNNLLERAIELQEQEYQTELRSMATTDKLSEALAGSVATYSDLLNGDALKTDSDLNNSMWNLFNINDRDIPSDMESGEFLARQIMEALGVENIDGELQKYFNEYGYWQSSWFWNDYVDRVAEDIQSGHSKIIDSISWDDAEFDSKDAFDSAIEETKNAAVAYSDVQTELAQANADVSDQLMLVAESNDKYAELSDSARQVISGFVDSFDIEDITKDGFFGGKVIDEDAINAAKAQINDFIDKITPDIQSLLNVGSMLKLGVDESGESLSVEAYQEQVKNFIDNVNNIEDEDLRVFIRTAFEIDEDSDGFDDEVSNAIEHAKNLLQDQYDDAVNDMTVEEVLQIYYNISAEPNSLTLEDLQTELLKTATSYETLSQTVSGIISNIENAQKVVASQVNGQSISIDDFNAEGMKEYRSALEYVNGSMQLNADKVREISEAKAEEQIAINETNKALAQSQYIENARQIEEYRQKLEDNTFAEGENEESVKASIDALLEENSTLADTCKQYDLLTASLKEAVGAYQNWLNAQSASDYGDMADDAVSAIQNIRDTYDSESEIFGNFGSKKFDAAIEFIIPESVDRDDLSAIESYMADFQSYLTFDEDGLVEGLNIDEFLNKSVEAGLMNYSDENGWTIAGQTAMEDFAEGLGLSMGVVQAFFDELQLKGAEFDWSDEAVKTFGDLAVEAGEAKEALHELYADDEELDIKIDVSDIETTEGKLSALDETIAEMNGIKSKVSVDSSEAEYANSVIRYCVEQKHLLTQPDVMRVDTSQVEGDLGDALLLLQQFQQAQNNLETLVAVGADTSEAEATVNSLAEKIQNQEATYINCGLDIDTTSIDTIQQSISGLTAEAIVTLGVDATAIDGYNPESKTCSVIYDPDTDLLPKSFGPYEATVEYIADLTDLPTHLKTLTRYVNHVAIGDVELNGTAHAGGTAKASGDWGTAKGGSTLVGELGREIVVDPRTGRWYTVGDNGAEFVNIPAGSIVFNHKQTESLLANGYVSGRASALMNGTAMVTGGYKPYRPIGTISSTGPSSSSNNNSYSSNSSYNKPSTVTVKADVDDTDLEEKLEETLEKMADEISEIIGNFEHSIFLLEHTGGTAEEIISIYRKMQEAVNKQADAYRKQGLDDNSDYIQDMEKQWWEYEDAIHDLTVQNYEDIRSELENAITGYENQLEQAEKKQNTRDIETYAGNMISYYEKLQDALHEQAEYYRSLGYSDTSDEVSELGDLWWEYADTISEIKQRVIDDIIEMVNAQSESVDEIQNVYDVLHQAADEYASGGYITVDSLQEIINLGAQYMQLLMNENGQLVINEENINAVIAARTRQLAVENAMAYVERIRLATQQGSIEELNSLIFVTNDATNSTWGLVYAELALLHQMGELTDTQYAAALHNIQALQSLANNAVAGIGTVAEATNTELNEMKDGLDSILEYVMEMLKQRINDQIDALEDMKDAYRDIIDLRKEALEAAKEEADYQDEVAEKIQEITELQERINALSLDDSRDAQSQKAELEEEMYELQKELADSQADYAMDAQKEALDNMADAYEQEKDKEIEILENSISSYQKLYDMAISYIQSHWGTLYSELIAWNTEYGNDLNSTITEAWNNALKAAQQYGSYVNALNSIQTDIDSSSGNSHNDIVSDVTHDNTFTNEDMIHSIIKEMYSNSMAHGAADAAKKEYLDKRNLTLGAMLGQYGIKAIRGYDGVWYVDKVGGDLLYEKYKQYLYHDGGIAGDKPTLKQNEVMAVLEKGEAVLDERKENALFRLIDFATNLSTKFGELMKSTGYNSFFDSSRSGLPEPAELAPVNESQSVNIEFGDVNIYGADDSTVAKHQEINRKFTNQVLRYVNIRK